MRRFVFISFALTVLAACQPATTDLTEEQKAEIAAEVDSVTNEWWTVWSTTHDFDRFISFCADEPEFAWLMNGHPFFTVREFGEAFRPGMVNKLRQENTPIEWRTIVLAHDVAYTVRLNSVVRVDTAGNTDPAMQYAETLVWVKRDGDWKVLIGHGSSPNESM